MFTIKVYDPGTMDYTAYTANRFRREYVGNSKGPDGVFRNVCRLVMWGCGNVENVGDSTCVEVHGTAYIENAAGKTIDTLYSKPVDESPQQ